MREHHRLGLVADPTDPHLELTAALLAEEHEESFGDPPDEVWLLTQDDQPVRLLWSKNNRPNLDALLEAGANWKPT